MSFARVDGMRHQRFMLLLGTPAGRVKNIISALVGEPLRILTSFFLHSSWWTDRNQPAPLVQLLQRASVLGAVLQYLSSMFRGLSSRWQILWRQMGCRCLTEFCERYPEDALLVRRAVLAVSAAVWRRHVKYLRQWEVFMLGDERRADQDLNSWCVQFFNSSSCCFKFGLGHRLHDLMSGHQPVEQKVAKLLSWRPAIREATWLIRVSIAAVERVHAGNRKRTHPQSKFGLFAAHNINVEVQNKYAAYRLLRAQRLAAHREAVQDRAEESHSATSLQYDEEEARDFRNNHLRAQTALQLFRTDWMADQRLQNLRWNPAGPATWPTIRAAFAALPSARLTHYENMAEASTSSARLARANFAQQARSTLPIAGSASADRSHVQHDQQHDETSSEAIVPVDDPILPDKTSPVNWLSGGPCQVVVNCSWRRVRRSPLRACRPNSRTETTMCHFMYILWLLSQAAGRRLFHCSNSLLLVTATNTEAKCKWQKRSAGEHRGLSRTAMFRSSNDFQIKSIINRAVVRCVVVIHPPPHCDSKPTCMRHGTTSSLPPA